MTRATQDLAALPELLRHIGDTGDYRTVPLAGGTNNRVFRVDTGARSYCYKVYQQRQGETRDRFDCEVRFLRFASRHGVRAIPELLAVDRESRSVLFRFLDGVCPGLEDIDRTLVAQAATFCADLDRCRDDPEAASLPAASDACVSLAEHVRSVERRLVRLREISAGSPVHREARAFAHDVLEPAFRRAEDDVNAFARSAGVPLDARLAPAEQCLSASDFGFHNAIMRDSRQVTFIDFEYAGWDDPAKMIADFFSQAERPVPLAFLDEFIAEVTARRRDGPSVAARAWRLLPLHRMKWAMIVMNDFLPGRRRDDASEMSDPGHLARRLNSAQDILSSIAVWYEPGRG